MLGAWMFLPTASYSLQGLPDITKTSLTCVSILLCCIIFDPRRIAGFRFFLLDLFLVLWILAPIPAHVFSPYGLYEGLGISLNQIVSWGIPYSIGRLYFPTTDGLNELAFAFVIAGLVYLPLVLLEVRFSPNLHYWIYGSHQHSFGQTRRLGGFRPMVFMQHGLAVALFMGTACLCGIYLWWKATLRPILSLPPILIVISLIIGTLLCKSSYAIILTCLSSGILLMSGRLNTKLLIIGLAIVAPTYLFSRLFLGWDAQILRDVANSMGEEREGSLAVRLNSENALIKWVQPHLYFGRARLEELMNAPREAWGRFIPDGFWVIALGKYGLLGLVSSYCVMLAPVFVFLRRISVDHMFTSKFSGATVLCVVLAMYALDNLLNAMHNPIYIFVAGGLISLQDDTFDSLD
jgi:hypothetical protein